MDYFSPTAGQFVNDLMQEIHDRQIELEGIYSDEMHIQQDWIYHHHMDYGQFTVRYVSPGFEQAFAQKHGTQFGNTGAAWVNIQGTAVGTFPYKTFMEANNVVVTMPTGYDQKCLIGYAATDSISKLKEFHQRERTITSYPSPQWAAPLMMQVTNPEVIDFGLTAVVPPIPCLVSFFATGTSLNTYGIGRFHALYMISAATSADMPISTIIGQISFSTTATATPPIWIEHQAALTKTGLASARMYPVSITF